MGLGERLRTFVSVDPLVNSGEPQRLNAYSYAGNNPIAMVDPAGLEPGYVPGEHFVGRGGSLFDASVGNAGGSTPSIPAGGHVNFVSPSQMAYLQAEAAAVTAANTYAFFHPASQVDGGTDVAAGDIQYRPVWDIEPFTVTDTASPDKDSRNVVDRVVGDVTVTVQHAGEGGSASGTIGSVARSQVSTNASDVRTTTGFSVSEGRPFGGVTLRNLSASHFTIGVSSSGLVEVTISGFRMVSDIGLEPVSPNVAGR
jgi:hypothetical protein